MAGSIEVYAFEDSAGGVDTFTTQDFDEAIEYAREHGMCIVEHTYEWADSVHVPEHDYRTAD